MEKTKTVIVSRYLYKRERVQGEEIVNCTYLHPQIQITHELRHPHA